MRRFYVITRDLHLSFGLFISPFILLFAISVFFLVHGLPNRVGPAQPDVSRTVTGLQVPPGAASLQGRARLDALRPVLDQLGVSGEVDFIRHVASEHRVVIPVSVPGRNTTVNLDYERGTAVVTSRTQPFSEALVYLHKTPGPHNVNLRGNAAFMRVWRVVADGTVYLFLFITVSGIYLWASLRAERRIGIALLFAGASLSSDLSMSSPASEISVPDQPRRNAANAFLVWNRRVHYYLGLYLLFFGWLFALTGLLLNHSTWEFTQFWPSRVQTTTTQVFRAPEASSDLARARDLMQQFGIAGEIQWPAAHPVGGPFTFQVSRPGRTVEVKADLATGQATLQRTDLNAWVSFTCSTLLSACELRIL